MTNTSNWPNNESSKILVLTTTVLLLGSTPTMADDGDKLELSAGGYVVFRYDSIVSLTETNAGVGASFSPRDTLGLDGEQTVFRLDGRYRFKPNHSLAVSWYRIGSNANRTLLDDIEWVDDDGNSVTIPIGTRVNSSLGYDIFKVSYLRSFYQSDKVELMAGAGLHWADLGFNLGIESELLDSELRKATSDIPMPVLSFGLEYKVTPKFDWYFNAESFALDLGDWRGLYSDIQLGVTYQLFDHVGAGIALGSNSLEVLREYSSDDVRFDFDNRVSGLYLFLSATF
jgi:hypothetical protein